MHQHAPDAIHVYDRFHVVQLVARAMDRTRRDIYRMTGSLEGRKVIQGSRWLLLKKDRDGMDKRHRRRLDNILETNKPLAMAYYLYEDIDQIWMQDSREEALEQLRYWCKLAEDSKLYYFRKAAASLMARREGILAWYNFPMSNARVEGTNNKIQLNKKKAYGYRDDKYFELILLGMHDNTNAIVR